MRERACFAPNRRIMVLKSAESRGEAAGTPPPSPLHRAAEMHAPMAEGASASSRGPVLKLRCASCCAGICVWYSCKSCVQRIGCRDGSHGFCHCYSSGRSGTPSFCEGRIDLARLVLRSRAKKSARKRILETWRSFPGLTGCRTGYPVLEGGRKRGSRGWGGMWGCGYTAN